MADMVEVEVKSGWASKINWAQIVGVAASVLVLTTGGKIDISPEMQASIVVAIQAIVSVTTVVFKTFYTATVTPSSVK